MQKLVEGSIEKRKKLINLISILISVFLGARKQMYGLK